MLFDNGGLFGDLDNLFCEKNTNFFTNTNPKTILGKNLVLNFLGEIEFEIRNLGFSNKANEIANFYEECKETTGMITFFTNPVIKMILSEIQNMPTIRTYLKNRIFDDIENDKRKSLDDIFNNNEVIFQKNIDKNREYLKSKILKDREIKKIMEKYNCDKEKAEQLYELQKMQSKKNLLEKELEASFKDILGVDLNSLLSDKPNIKIQKPSKNNGFEISITNDDMDNNIDIQLDDNDNIRNDNSNGFWF